MEQLYSVVKDIHNILRWVILVLAVITIVKYLVASINKSHFRSIDNRLSIFYVTSLDVQLLLGLFLYFFLSPVTQSVMQYGDAPLEDPNTRFFSIEHPVTMLLAIIFAHIGRIACKRATTSKARFKRGALWFTLSLILILAGIPW